MEDYLLALSVLAVATLIWLAGVVRVVVGALVVGLVAGALVDQKPADFASNPLLWSAFLFSRDGTPKSELAWRRGFNPLLDLDPVGLSQYWGYDAETHHVTTEDGYILGIHRILGPKDGVLAPVISVNSNRLGRRAAVQAKPVVILAHPLLSSSSEWIIAGPGKALAYLLSDQGYDVWMFNVRGNTYSLNHTTLTPDDAAFWDFSYHEHATKDMPALIEYVVRETGQQQMQYVGFSMGTTIMFIMASERPEVAKHIRMFTALGPATALMHTRSETFRVLAHALPALMRSSAMFGVHNFLPSTAALRTAGEIFCSDGSITQGLCVGLIAALSGRNDAQNNRTMLPYIISRTPSGSSFKTLNHFAQSMKTGFLHYDYGKKENLKRYGQEKPPKYDVSKVTIPTHIYYGLNDHLADPRDVTPVCEMLPNLLTCEAVADPQWTHLDFVWAKQAPTLVYTKVLKAIKLSDANAAAAAAA